MWRRACVWAVAWIGVTCVGGCTLAKTSTTTSQTPVPTGPSQDAEPTCHDADGDGVAKDCEPIDCDDRDDSVWVVVTGYFDLDGDGVRSPTERTACVGDVVDALVVGTDCDDSNPDVFRSESVFLDHDGDGYTAGQSLAACVGSTLPSGVSLTASTLIDCNDDDALVYDGASLFVDGDNDTYTVGDAVPFCRGAALPTGFAATRSAFDDCDDDAPSVFNGSSLYVDSDSDGYTVGDAVPFCRGATLPSGFSLTRSAFDDCDDSAGSVWERLQAYGDADGDGHRSTVSVEACMGAGADAVRTAGDDACDDDTDNWTSANCAACGADADDDGSVTSCDRYTEHAGPDCAPTDPLIGTLALDLPGNSIDEDCGSGDAAASDATAYFVDCSVTSGGEGSMLSPFGDLNQAISAAHLSSVRKVVLIKQDCAFSGTFFGASAVNVAVVGGYDSTWALQASQPTQLVSAAPVEVRGGGSLYHIDVPTTGEKAVLVATEIGEHVRLHRVTTTVSLPVSNAIGVELVGQGLVRVSDCEFYAARGTADLVDQVAVGLAMSGTQRVESYRSSFVGADARQAASVLGVMASDHVEWLSYDDDVQGGPGAYLTFGLWLRGQSRLVATASRFDGVGRLGFSTFATAVRSSDQSELVMHRSLLVSGVGNNNDSASRARAVWLESTGAQQELVGNVVVGGVEVPSGSVGYATVGVLVSSGATSSPPIVAFNTVFAGEGDGLRVGLDVTANALIENNIVLASGTGSTAIVQRDVVNLRGNDLYGASLACVVGSDELTCTMPLPSALTDGNFSADPMLDAGYHLQAASPCIDAAQPSLRAYPIPADRDGSARPIGAAFDVGADEYLTP